MKNSPSLIIAMGILLGFASLGFFIQESIVSLNSAQRSVVVKGLAEKDVLANNVVWPLSFRVNANSLDELHTLLGQSTAKIQAFLEKNGIAPAEISLVAPNIEDKTLYASQDNKPIYAYSALGTVTVNSQQVTHIAKLSQNVEELIKQGVALDGNFGRMAYTYTQLNDIKPAMIEEATKNARFVAHKFAEDSQSHLGKIKKANQGLFSLTTPDTYRPERMRVRIVSTVEYYLVD